LIWHGGNDTTSDKELCLSHGEPTTETRRHGENLNVGLYTGILVGEF